jgi:WhiB family redox-sensing transcriptional regulator
MNANTETWRQAAACRGMDPKEADRLFFTAGPPPQEAVRKCGGCPVRQDCQAYGLAGREEYGVFGGLSPSDRDRLLRARLLRPSVA